MYRPDMFVFRKNGLLLETHVVQEAENLHRLLCHWPRLYRSRMVSHQRHRGARQDQAYPNSLSERIGECTIAKLYTGSKYQRIRECDDEHNEIQICWRPSLEIAH
jgi:hypothetical protein